MGLLLRLIHLFSSINEVFCVFLVNLFKRITNLPLSKKQKSRQLFIFCKSMLTNFYWEYEYYNYVEIILKPPLKKLLHSGQSFLQGPVILFQVPPQ
jgi:hypothetical protein